MKVRDLLTAPDKWTKGALARDKNGGRVWSGSEDAVCWCLGGAMLKCYPDPDHRLPIIHRIHSHNPKARNIPAWQDAPERTFDDVRKLVEELDI